MTLRLSVENMDRMPDGGPLSMEVHARGLDIGRDSHLDWSLPDPSRHVSGKHCEIRYRDGGYWLHDVSTNGTFVNGSQFRLDAPYLLRDGDRLAIGQYLIGVEVKAGNSVSAANSPIGTRSASVAAPAFEVWQPEGESAAPADRRSFMPAASPTHPADFLDFATPAAAPPLRQAVDDSWMIPSAAPSRALSTPSEPPTPFAAPSPRRPAVKAPPGELVSPSHEGETSAQPPVSSAPPSTEDGDILARIAKSAGLSASAFSGRDRSQLADEIGEALRLTAGELSQLLRLRAESKSLLRTASRTMIQAAENNPLKFSASPGDALAVMFGPPSRSYLNARASLAQSFADVKAHQADLLSAVQFALEALFEDLSPNEIEKSAEPDRGLGALVGSRKAKLWDMFVDRWRAKTKRSDGRLTEAFAVLLAEAYDKLQERR